MGSIHVRVHTCGRKKVLLYFKLLACSSLVVTCALMIAPCYGRSLELTTDFKLIFVHICNTILPLPQCAPLISTRLTCGGTALCVRCLCLCAQPYVHVESSAPFDCMSCGCPIAVDRVVLGRLPRCFGLLLASIHLRARAATRKGFRCMLWC
jgi:hypothetical protein